MKKVFNTIVPILLIITVYMLTAGYSAFVSTLNITHIVAHIRDNSDTRVTNVTTNSPYISNLDYGKTTIHADANIPNGSSVTFNTTVTTFGNVKMALTNISVTNGANTINNVGITPVFNTSNPYIRICDVNENCTLGSSKEISITITNNTGSAINTDNLIIDLSFVNFYTVTLDNNLLGYVLHNGTFSYTFSSNTPSSISVTTGTCGTPSISNDVLTIANVTTDLVLASGSGGGSGTQQDPYIDSSQTYDISNLQDGYTVFTDVPGEPKINATVTVGVTTINSFEFTDTGTNGVTFGTNDNPKIDTGVLVLDSQNSAFSIHIVFKTTLKLTVNNTNINSGKFVLAALSEVSSNTYSGFSIWVLNSSTPTLNIGIYDRKTYSNGVLSATRNQVLTTSGDANSGVENVYEVWMSYDQRAFGGKAFKYQCFNNENNNGTNNCSSTSQQSLQKKNIPTGLTNTTITIGGNGLNSSNDIGSMTIMELQICKGQFTTVGSNYTCAS